MWASGPGRQGEAQASRKAAWVLPRQGSAHLVQGSRTPPSPLPRACRGFPLQDTAWRKRPGSLPPLLTPEALPWPWPCPRPPCDQRKREGGRTRRKLPRPSIISQIQAPWLLRASGDGALMAVPGLLRGCSNLASGNVPRVRLTSARKGCDRAALGLWPGV